MARNEFPFRRPVGIALALGAILVLGGCETLNEAFSGVNPVARKLDDSAAGRSGADGKTEQLAIPPGYGQRPAAAKATGSDTRNTVDAPKAGAGKPPEKAGDPKKIDLKTGTADEAGEEEPPKTSAKNES